MDHELKVEKIVDQLRHARRLGRPVEFAKKSVSHFVPNPYQDADVPRIDLSPLNEVLEIDVDGRTCVVESGTTFGDLIEATLEHGLAPYTVSELEGITVGGAVSGCSVESMSYRHGGLHDRCREYEVITGEGEVLRCSPEQDPDVFHMMHGSYGSLGILSKLRIELCPALPFVRMEYRRHRTFDAFWSDLLERCARADHTFVDGIIHGRDSFVLCLGEFVDQVPFTSSYDGEQIYYKSTATRQEDYLTTRQYFFRYDTECHWLSRTVPLLENRLVRRALGKHVLGSSNMITWSNRLRRPLRMIQRRPDVTVDVFIPSKRFEEFFRWYEVAFNYFPLWVVPYRMPEIYPWIADGHAERVGEPFVIDAAIYGKPNQDPNVDFSEVLEREVYRLGGVKTLISRNHYDEETFWSIYSRPRHEAAKGRLDPHNVFGGLYERFAPANYGPRP